MCGFVSMAVLAAHFGNLILRTREKVIGDQSIYAIPITDCTAGRCSSRFRVAMSHELGLAEKWTA